MNSRVTHPALAGPSVREGFLALVPLWLAAGPFGALYAMQARLAGLSLLETQAMSLLVFAGASQFTAVTLLLGGADALSVILTTFIVNLRHSLLAASIAPYLRNVGALARAGLAFQLTDESYALSIRRFNEGTGSAAYLLGTNMSMYVCWQSSTFLGYIAGAALPDPAYLPRPINTNAARSSRHRYRDSGSSAGAWRAGTAARLLVSPRSGYWGQLGGRAARRP
jgi:predicted branched-subunit amino acid permease